MTDAKTCDRGHAAWRSWLSALATDSEAALAAALTYEALDGPARDAWLDVLAQDSPMLETPLLALYAPLLAVESDEGRRARIADVLADCADGSAGLGPVTAFRGIAIDGSHLCLIMLPLYLNFVETLTCRYTPTGGFQWARHETLRHIQEVTVRNDFLIDGVAVEDTPLRVVIEELAHAVVAERRAERTPPAVLAPFAHLFAPDFDAHAWET